MLGWNKLVFKSLLTQTSPEFDPVQSGHSWKPRHGQSKLWQEILCISRSLVPCRESFPVLCHGAEDGVSPPVLSSEIIALTSAVIMDWNHELLGGVKQLVTRALCQPSAKQSDLLSCLFYSNCWTKPCNQIICAWWVLNSISCSIITVLGVSNLVNFWLDTICVTALPVNISN